MLLLNLHHCMCMFVHQHKMHMYVHWLMYVHVRLLNSVHMYFIQHYAYTSASPEICAYAYWLPQR